jgi:hypothetical protein
MIMCHVDNTPECESFYQFRGRETWQRLIGSKNTMSLVIANHHTCCHAMEVIEESCIEIN